MCCSAVLDFAAIQLQFRVAQHRSCAAASPAAALSAADTKMSTRQSLSKHRFSEQTQERYTTCLYVALCAQDHRFFWRFVSAAAFDAQKENVKMTMKAFRCHAGMVYYLSYVALCAQDYRFFRRFVAEWDEGSVLMLPNWAFSTALAGFQQQRLQGALIQDRSDECTYMKIRRTCCCPH